MKTLRSPVLAAFLVALLVMLGGVLSAQAVGHVSQHTHHHTSGAHATTLCSWYCAAGQVDAGELVIVATPVLSFLGMANWQPTTIFPSFIIPSASRAPPSV